MITHIWNFWSYGKEWKTKKNGKLGIMINKKHRPLRAYDEKKTIENSEIMIKEAMLSKTMKC